MYYRLRDDHAVEPCSMEVWTRFCEDREARVVARTDLPAVMVSTVFLGLDHGWQQGRPILFETMVFRRRANGDLDWSDLACDRYATWDEAVAGHAAMVKRWARKKVLDRPAT